MLDVSDQSDASAAFHILHTPVTRIEHIFFYISFKSCILFVVNIGVNT